MVDLVDQANLANLADLITSGNISQSDNSIP